VGIHGPAGHTGAAGAASPAGFVRLAGFKAPRLQQVDTLTGIDGPDAGALHPGEHVLHPRLETRPVVKKNVGVQDPLQVPGRRFKLVGVPTGRDQVFHSHPVPAHGAGKLAQGENRSHDAHPSAGGRPFRRFPAPGGFAVPGRTQVSAARRSQHRRQDHRQHRRRNGTPR